jgi:hypothetical protein
MRQHSAVTVGICLGALLTVGVARAADWTPATTGAFRASRDCALLPDRGLVTRSLAISYPSETTSQPGQYGEWATTVRLPAGRCLLAFYQGDDFTGPTAGYHFLQVLLDGQVIWERDVAGGALGLERAQVALPEVADGQPHRLAVRLQNKRLVTNYPVQVQFADISLSGDRQTISLLPLEPPMTHYTEFPPDLPLPALPVIGGWTWQANIVQPWGDTQTVAVRHADEWSRRFARDHGLNAIIMLPPDAHNALTAEADHITPEEFRGAVAAYRRAGMKFILYSAVMHVGHDPIWMSGDLFRSHPEWAMRDPAGGTVNEYGHPWLCPSTGALDFTLDYTARIVREYGADAVMLDNNEFLQTAAGGATCYCDSCRAKFREYVLARFGERRLHEVLGLTPTQVKLPEVETDPLWGLWLAWRNRVWGETCERFRQRLRQIRPDLVLLANTQYEYSSWILAVDGQYPHLDTVLSESRGLTGPGMAAKMLLGRALAEGRPLWNYIGTFREDDLTRLRPPDEIAAICAASEAYGTNPWIVFYGFIGEENQPSLAVIRQYTDFWRENADLLGASKLRGDVGVLVSTESRDLAGVGPAPPFVPDLITRGLAVRGFRDTPGFAGGDLEGVRVLAATHNPCLRQATADQLAAWVRGGGRLVIAPSTGWRDEYGRWRSTPALNGALAADVATAGEHRCGKGRVICAASDADAVRALRRRATSRVHGAGPLGVCWNVAPDGRTVLSVVGFEGPVGKIRVRLPADLERVELRVPGQAPQSLPISGERGRRTVTCEVAGRLALLVGAR